MDVLELPRPVINFLRTMAKESCRYALSWDIFGGPDSVTLTLTWKLIEDEPLSTLINEATATTTTNKSQGLISDDSHLRSRSNVKTNASVTSPTSSSSPRRSRRDEPPPPTNNNNNNNDSVSVPAIFRSSRGKSLEGSSSQLNKTLVSHSVQSKPHPVNHYHHRQKKSSMTTHTSKPPPPPPPSDQIYGHLYDTRSASVVKCATISSLSSSSPSPQPNSNPPHLRPKATTTPPPTHRKFIRPSSSTATATATRPVSSNYAKLQRLTTNHLARQEDDDDDDSETKDDDDDDETLDPWVKRFECSLEDHQHDETTELSEEKECSIQRTIPNDTLDESTLPSGKVKFKSKPDYF